MHTCLSSPLKGIDIENLVLNTNVVFFFFLSWCLTLSIVNIGSTGMERNVCKQQYINSLNTKNCPGHTYISLTSIQQSTLNPSAEIFVPGRYKNSQNVISIPLLTLPKNCTNDLQLQQICFDNDDLLNNSIINSIPTVHDLLTPVLSEKGDFSDTSMGDSINYVENGNILEDSGREVSENNDGSFNSINYVETEEMMSPYAHNISTPALSQVSDTGDANNLNIFIFEFII